MMTDPPNIEERNFEFEVDLGYVIFEKELTDAQREEVRLRLGPALPYPGVREIRLVLADRGDTKGPEVQVHGSLLLP